MLKRTDAELIKMKEEYESNLTLLNERLTHAKADKELWTVSMQNEAPKLKSVKFYQSNKSVNKEYIRAVKFNRNIARPVHELTAEIVTTEKNIKLIEAILTVRANENKWKNHIQEYEKIIALNKSDPESRKQIDNFHKILLNDYHELHKCMHIIGQNRNQNGMTELFNELSSINNNLNDAIRETEKSLGIYLGPATTALNQQKNRSNDEEPKLKSVKFYQSNKIVNKEYFRAEKVNRNITRSAHELAAEQVKTKKNTELTEAIQSYNANEKKWINHIQEYKEKIALNKSDPESLKDFHRILLNDYRELHKCMHIIGQNRNQNGMTDIFNKLSPINTNLLEALEKTEKSLGIYSGPSTTDLNQQENQSKKEPVKTEDFKRVDTLYNHIANQQNAFAQEASSTNESKHSQAATVTQSQLNDVKNEIDRAKEQTDKKEISSAIKKISLELKGISTSIKSGMESLTQLKTKKQASTEQHAKPQTEPVVAKFGR